MYGISFGGALALEAAKRLASVTKLVVYEAPFIVDDSRPPVPEDYASTMDSLLAANRRGAAVKHFMRKGVGLPAIATMMMPLMPAWPKLKAVAHTLPYDVLLTERFQKGTPLPADYWASLQIPALVIYGGKSPMWMQNGMKALAAALPQASLSVLPGETHIVKPKSLAPLMIDFYRNETGRFMLPVSQENREKAGIQAGDEVEVELELDTAPRELTLPEDFQEALEGNEEARRFFESLSYSNKRRFVLNIEGGQKRRNPPAADCEVPRIAARGQSSIGSRGKKRS